VEIAKMKQCREIFPGVDEIRRTEEADSKPEEDTEAHSKAIGKSFISKAAMVQPLEFRFGGAVGTRSSATEKSNFGELIGSRQDDDRRSMMKQQRKKRRKRNSYSCYTEEQSMRSHTLQSGPFEHSIHRLYSFSQSRGTRDR
jgi:hypothetical protein